MNPRKLLLNTVIFIIILAWFSLATTRILSGECMGKGLDTKTSISENARNLCQCTGLQYSARRLGESPKACCLGFSHNCHYAVDLNTTDSSKIASQEYFGFYQPKLDALKDKSKNTYFTFAILPVESLHYQISQDEISYECSSLINPEVQAKIRFEIQPVQSFDKNHLLVPFLVHLKDVLPDKYKCEITLAPLNQPKNSAILFIDK